MFDCYYATVLTSGTEGFTVSLLVHFLSVCPVQAGALKLKTKLLQWTLHLRRITGAQIFRSENGRPHNMSAPGQHRFF